MAARLFASPAVRRHVRRPSSSGSTCATCFPPTHWAVRGEPPAFDTPDEDVYLDGRNVILLSKAAVYMVSARRRHAPDARLLLGTLAGNPFPDATPEFFDAHVARAVARTRRRRSPSRRRSRRMHKSDVIRRGLELGVPLELTLSCMQPKDGLHCGRVQQVPGAKRCVSERRASTIRRSTDIPDPLNEPTADHEVHEVTKARSAIWLCVFVSW